MHGQQKRHCCQNTNPIFTILRNTECLKLPFEMSFCLWKCIFTLVQKIQFGSPNGIYNIRFLIKGFYSVQQEMLAITRRHLCPQPQKFIIRENPRSCSEEGQCHICYIDGSVKSNKSVIKNGPHAQISKLIIAFERIKKNRQPALCYKSRLI